MSKQDVTPREALLRLGASTAEAVARALETFMPSGIERGEVTVLPDGQNPFTDLPLGTVAASVSYVGGVTGANVFVMDPAGARAVATAMGIPERPSGADPRGELSEFELSAIAEATNHMMAAAASAISVVLGQEVEISPPDTRVLDDQEEAADLYGDSTHATSTTFEIAGHSCRLVQLVPSTFVMRVARAIDEQTEGSGDTSRVGRSGTTSDGSVGLPEALSMIRLRVWTELGRTRMPLGQALELPFGAVIDLDRAADSPVDLFVNGLRFAHGQLIVTDDGEWAVRLESIAARGGQTQPVSLGGHAEGPGVVS